MKDVNNGEKIDFVIPWVDGNDPEWIKQFNNYIPETSQKKSIDTRMERYRDYGLLKYWFRGVEKYAPWVNKVHFITCGQKPEWLNLDCPKLNWVKHSDYIPSKYLPVFSSHPIELFLNRIPGLADHFVYFNDDFFLISPVSKEYFFKNGLPCDIGSFSVIGLGEGKLRIPHIQLNNMIEINKYFNKKDIIKNNFCKWFSLGIGRDLIKNIISIPYDTIASLSIRHFAQPYLKSTFENVWDNCSEVLNQTAGHRFRNQLEDVNQWLFRFWQLCSGDFIPINNKKNEKMIKLSEWTNLNNKAIITHKYKEICIDDDTDEKSCPEYESKMKAITDSFEAILSEKSTFEL